VLIWWDVYHLVNNVFSFEGDFMKTQMKCAALFCLLALSLTLLAQESAVKGNLSGVVSDASGAVVANATVTLTGPIGTKSGTTGPDGRFQFSLLTPGLYSVRAENKGFKASEVKGIEVFTNRTSSVSMSLQPGGASETVEVSAAAVTVDTGATGVSANMNDQFYENMPVARNVTGLFYASAGVTDGGGTGSANPSIAGGSGLENQYVADGVNITDGAFGGIGVFSRVYGPLATGINLSFVKEVEVKTAGYEPQYGKSTGGLVQIVTKSGTNEYHGAASAFYAPQQFEVTHLNPDASGRLNQQGVAYHQAGWDFAGEFGGPVPGRLKDKLFFFGSFNPSWNRYYDTFAPLHGVTGFPQLANAVIPQLSYDYAGKLTWKISDKHQVETSIFGDPTHETSAAPNNTLDTYTSSTFSKINNGTRNWVVRYNATLSPTWLVNVSWSWGHNYLNEVPNDPNVYRIFDVTGAGDGTSALGPDGTPLTGNYDRQGLGYYEDTSGDNYSLTFDTQKVVNKFGGHTFSLGYHYDRNYYSGSALRSGPRFTITPTMAANAGFPQIAGQTDNATFEMASAASFGFPAGSVGVYGNIPGYSTPQEVVFLQDRGTYSSPHFDTSGRYHAAYVNDSWAINKHFTVNAGYRWEQQMMQGTPYVNPLNNQPTQVHYTFTDNWSPRFGLAIDPKGDRKTKIYGNFARYSYAIPLDMAIRSLSNEQDAYFGFWTPPSTGPSDGSTANLAVNSDGSITPILDDAHALTPLFVSFQSGEAIAKGTKMQYLQEWAYGAEHEFKHGIVVDVRWQDRRLKRIVEDMSGTSPEGAQIGVAQQFQIGNPSGATDLFTNPIEIGFPAGTPPPAGCNGAFAVGNAINSGGQVVGGVCVTNANAGFPIPDGKPDGFVNPERIYKGLEFEATKSFSSGWQWRTNYRWAELLGNYEGAFRNDNGQSDPSISSLFDFTPGIYGLLGDQFAIGSLNTDRRHTFNNFISYTFSSTMLKNLTVGTGVRIQTGAPVNDLRAHPVYQNAGEIPIGGRGALGRTDTNGQADLHLDYVLKTGEKSRVHFGADLFNITNQKTQLRIDQDQDASFGVPNFDFLHPVGNGNIGIAPGYQRPFYARLMAKWEF
jgi:hypothetical protein